MIFPQLFEDQPRLNSTIDVHQVRRDYFRETIASRYRAPSRYKKRLMSCCQVRSTYEYSYGVWFHALTREARINVTVTPYARNTSHDYFVRNHAQTLFRCYFHAVRTRNIARLFLCYHTQRWSQDYFHAVRTRNITRLVSALSRYHAQS